MLYRTAYCAAILFPALSFAAFQQKSKQEMEHQKITSPVLVNSPDFTYDIRFAGLALVPYANNSDYAAEALPFNYGDAEPALSPSWSIQEISPQFHFGFDLAFMGFFHSIGSSLMINWEYYHSPNDTDSDSVSSTDMIGPFFEIGPDASAYKSAKGKARYHFDEINLDYGTFVQFGSLLQTNLFAGVGLARIVQYRYTTFSNPGETTVRSIRVPSKYLGAGPQLGVDFRYKIYHGFELVGNSRASIFIGSFDNYTRYSTASTDLVDLGDESPNIQTTSVQDKSGMVPGFEGKLGLAYEYLFKGNYWLKVEAGYQAQVYINAIRSIDMGSEVALSTAGSIGSATTGVYARTFERTVSDFGLAGPYASIDFGF